MSTLKFKCFIPEVNKNFPIKKVKPNNFKWFEKAINDYKKNKDLIHTSKCPGIISILNTGWIQYAYQDFTIETNGDLKNFKWTCEINQSALKHGNLMGEYIHYHPVEELEKFKPFPENVLHTIIKIQSPWTVDIPVGYKLLSMPIPYNDDTRFMAAHGFLIKKNWLNVQLYWYKTNSRETIKKGTPLCQYLLVKDEDVEYSVNEINKKEIEDFKNEFK